MLTISKTLPFEWWPIASKTFNESKFGFISSRPYFQEWLDSDDIKQQITDTDINGYGIQFVDESDNVITYKDFTKSVVSGVNVFDMEFSFAGLPVAITDKRIRAYLIQSPKTFDDTFDNTFDPTVRIYKTDLMDVRSVIENNLGWGSEVINFKSLTNYADIIYPNNGNYFNLRIPCRLYDERIQETVSEIQLSDNVLATSRTLKPQIYLETYLLPPYMMKKIVYALSHDVEGSVQINNVEYKSEAMEWSRPDSRSPLFKGKVWLTDKVNFVRNII